MSEHDPKTETTLEELIVFRDDVRQRREQLINSEDGKDPHAVFFIDSLLQALDKLVDDVTSTKDQPLGATDQAQCQDLMAKTVFKVQSDPLDSLNLPASPAPGGQKKRE